MADHSMNTTEVQLAEAVSFTEAIYMSMGEELVM